MMKVMPAVEVTKVPLRKGEDEMKLQLPSSIKASSSHAVFKAMNITSTN